VTTVIQSLPVQEQIGGQAPSDRAERTADGRFTLSTAIVPAILLLAYLSQCVWFIRSQSFTFDEPTDILAGLEQWRTGQYSGGQAMNDHPPLARLLCTLPAINSRFQVGDKIAPNIESLTWHNSDFDSFRRFLPSPEAVAWRTRLVDAILGAVLGLLLWLAARSLYSTHVANFVLALFSFSPSLIAHFSLAATNDGVMALMFFATVFQLCRWRRDQSWLQTVLLGSLLGGFLIAKGSALPFFGLAIVLMLILKPDTVAIRASEWNCRQALVALLISFLIVWGAYRFHVSKVTLTASDIQVRVAIPERPDPIIRQSSRAFHISLPVPALEFLQGLGYQLRHAEGGHFGFLLGHRYIGGSKLFFPIVILLKWPTIVLLLFLTAMGLMFLGRSPLQRDLILWSAFPVLYFLLAVFAQLNLGERYILPIYPFALLLCGSVWQFARGRRAVLVLLLCALTVHVGDVLRYAPDYLSYFNLFVRSANSYKILSDSNVDWGEGLIALRDYQRAHPSVPIHLAYFGSVAPDVYGIQAIPLMPNDRVSGTVIVSAMFLSGQTLPDSDSYHWVLRYPLKLILNHSLYVFEVPDQAKQQ
jgi:hypothetical protein